MHFLDDPLAGIFDDLHVQEEVKPADLTFNGYSNSNTWHVALILSNDAEAVRTLQKESKYDGSIEPIAVKSFWERNLKKFKPLFEEMEWLEGDINWAEVAQDIEPENKGVPISYLGIIANSHICTASNSLTLPMQLDRQDYQVVNKILLDLGGTWNKKTKSHVFAEPVAEVLDAFLLTGEVTKRRENPNKIYGFFPTPERLVAELLEISGVSVGDLVLEPSSGSLRIARAAADIVGVDSVHCVEIQPHLASMAVAAGFPTVEGDFLELSPEPIYDRVVANPPFSKMADARHFLHAAKWVRPGGMVTAILSAGVKFRNETPYRDLRDLISQKNGMIIDLPPNSFRESGTSVSTVIVHIEI